VIRAALKYNVGMNTTNQNPLSQTLSVKVVEDPSERRIRSFVLRQGRLTKGQARALELVFPKFGITYQPHQLDLNVLFGRPQSKKILEIGFGMGETTAKIANTLPDCDFLAAEVHTPGVGALLKLIDEQSLSNIRVIQHDVVEVLHNMIADGSLDGVHIFSLILGIRNAIISAV